MNSHAKEIDKDYKKLHVNLHQLSLLRNLYQIYEEIFQFSGFHDHSQEIVSLYYFVKHPEVQERVTSTTENLVWRRMSCVLHRR